MPKQIVKTVYQFQELSDVAKAKAREYTGPLAWSEEIQGTLKAFCDIFPVRVRDWSYGSGGGYIDFRLSCDDEAENLEGLRLYKYLVNNYVQLFTAFKTYRKGDKKRRSKISQIKDYWQQCLTGYCMDYEILDPLFNFLARPEKNMTFYALMKACLDAWINSAVKECEWQESDEYLEEFFNANEFWFYENGGVA
jgi:hypothetical protein